MPLEILLIFVVAGIAGIALLLHFLGLSRGAVFADEDAARAAWLREFPYETPGRITLSSDRRAALLCTHGGTGVAWCLGADTVARPLVGADLRATEAGLRILFHDPALAPLTIALSAPDRAVWRAKASFS